MRWQLVVLALLFALPAIAAAESLDYCINDTWAMKRIDLPDLGVNSTEYINCTLGCLNGQCLPEPNQSNDIALIAGLGMIAFFFIYGAFKFDKGKHAPLQILFLFMALFSVIMLVGTLSAMAKTNGQTAVDSMVSMAYTAIVYVTVFIAFYFVVWFIYEVFTKLHNDSRR